jgi:hypothetical protein
MSVLPSYLLSKTFEAPRRLCRKANRVCLWSNCAMERAGVPNLVAAAISGNCLIALE